MSEQTTHGQRPLAFITSDILSFAGTTVVRGAESIATEHRNPFRLAFTHEDGDYEKELIETLCTQQVAAVILTDSTEAVKADDERIADYCDTLGAVGARLVLCGHPPLPALPKVLTVNYDQVGGVRKVVVDLANKGHSRIAFLGCGTSAMARQRFLGYTLGLQDAGVSMDSSLMIACPDATAESHLAALLLLRSPNPPTGIICLTDAIAMGVYRAARDSSIEIPSQVAITGFGDSPYTGDLSPGLTSVHVPYFDLGASAAKLGLGVGDDSMHAILPTTVVLRESSG